MPALLQAAQEHQQPRQEQVRLERPPRQCLPRAAPAHGQLGLRNPESGGTFRPGLGPHSCSLCTHQPMSLCPAPTAALGPSWRRQRWPTGHSSALNSDNFSAATAAQLCPTPASWGSELNPGAAAVIYKVNFIKFVTIPCFSCWEVHPLAATRLSWVPDGLFREETTSPRPRGGASRWVASRGQQSDGPAGRGKFRLILGEGGPSNSAFHG